MKNPKLKNLLPAPLVSLLERSGRLAIAFSGGLDSRFLAHAALLCGSDSIAIHIDGPHILPAESDWAEEWARKVSLPFVRIWFNPLSEPDVASNSKQRCYSCKKGMLGAIQSFLARTGESGRLLCDGGNLDDLEAYRPGIQAVKEAGVCSPLALSGLSKNGIRHYARLTGLDRPDQKARPCLLTRFAYNTGIDISRLNRVAELETALAEVIYQASGRPDFRLRFCPEPELHVTQEASEIIPRLQKTLVSVGLPDCPIRIMPKLSGYFDQVTPPAASRETDSCMSFSFRSSQNA